MYVGKRGGAVSIKQAEIDKLLVALCQQVRWLPGTAVVVCSLGTLWTHGVLGTTVPWNSR